MNRKPIFKVIFLNESTNKKIINQYWEINNDTIGWKNSVQKVAELNKKSMRNVSSYVKENSTFELYCTECKNLILSCNLRSKVNWSDFLFGSEIRCKNCCSASQASFIHKKLEKEIEQNLKSAKKMNIAFETKQWLNLNQPELEVLIKVAEAKSRSEIYSKVFPDKNLRSQYNEFYWKILNYLDDLNLIWIERENNGSIIQFHKHGELYKTLLKDYPELIIPREEPKTPKKYGFSLKKNDNRKSKEPYYSGEVEIKTDIEFTKDTILQFAIWKDKKDGLYVRVQDK